MLAAYIERLYEKVLSWEMFRGCCSLLCRLTGSGEEPAMAILKVKGTSRAKALESSYVPAETLDDVEWSSPRGRPYTRYDVRQSHQAVKSE